MIVCRLLFKAKIHHLLDIHMELTWHPIAQQFTCRAHFLLHYQLILLMLGLRFCALPGELPSH